MDKANLKNFLRRLRPNAEVIDNGQWLNTSCPLAPWTHERGSDRNPSFGVHVSDDQSLFNCLACHKKGSLLRLLNLLEGYSGEDYEYLKIEVEGEGVLAPPIPPVWGRDSGVSSRDILGEPVDEEALSLYDSALGHPYLARRGVMDETAEDLGLRLDPNNHGVERILFPVFSPEGEFYGYTGRATSERCVPKVRDYFGLDKRLLLLGSHLVVPERRATIVLVEGLFDYAIVSQLGYPVVASMHANLTGPQASILRSFGMPVVVFYDNDNAGRTGTGIVAKALRGYVPVLGVTYHRGVGKADPGSLSDEDIECLIDNAHLL